MEVCFAILNKIPVTVWYIVPTISNNWQNVDTFSWPSRPKRSHSDLTVHALHIADKSCNLCLCMNKWNSSCHTALLLLFVSLCTAIKRNWNGIMLLCNHILYIIHCRKKKKIDFLRLKWKVKFNMFIQLCSYTVHSTKRNWNECFFFYASYITSDNAVFHPGAPYKGEGRQWSSGTDGD